MKNLNHLTILLVGLVLFSCKDRAFEEVTYIANEPVYLTYEELNASIKSEPVRTIENPGKIYYYQNYLLINERFKGIHVVDNIDPSNPRKISFINIPANIDMVVKGNILYADNYKNLLSIDISNIENITVLDRDENIFPYALPPRDNTYPMVGVDENKGVVVGWKEKEVTEKREITSNPNNCFNCTFRTPDAAVAFDSPSKTSGNYQSTTGIGGSLARFTLVGNYLYGVHGEQLKTIDISSPINPTLVNTISLSRNVETIFPAKKDKLFIGTTTGMLIYDISNPSSPYYLSSFNHARNCDPVVVEGDYAYVTIRSGGRECWGSLNQLDVINIKDLQRPVLEKTYQFSNPHGLGIDNGTLFICDGAAGLKVYNASNVYEITDNKLAGFPNIQATDVIPFNNVLMMIGDDGFYQYDYTDINNISLLSTIKKGQ